MSNPIPPQPFDEVKARLEAWTRLGSPKGSMPTDAGWVLLQADLRSALAHIADLERRLGEREREADEALCLAEGPSTLLDLARGSLLRGFQVHSLTNRVERLREAAKAVYDEYDRDEECDEVRLNQNIETLGSVLYDDTSPGGGDGTH